MQHRHNAVAIFRRAVVAARKLPTPQARDKTIQNFKNSFRMYRSPSFDSQRAELLHRADFTVALLEKLCRQPPELVSALFRKREGF